MILTSIDSLKVGDKITYAAFMKDGRKILSEDTVLNEFYIKKLGELGIKHIYIHSESFSDINNTYPININTRCKALGIYNKMKKLLEQGKEINEDEIKQVIKEIVEDVKSIKIPLLILNSLYPEDDKLAMHALNTAIISISIGTQLSYNFSQLCDLGIAGFIHDIGREIIDDDSDERHVQKGFEALRKTHLFSISSTAVGYQHHENYNGVGFPRGIKGDEITAFSQIVSVADYFDSLISGHFGEKMTHEEAYNEVINNSNIKFSPEVIKVFKNIIQVYFNGMHILLSDGTQGVVVEQNVGRPLRPVIRTFSEALSEYFKEVNLNENMDKKIHSAIL